MAGLCEGDNEPPRSLKVRVTRFDHQRNTEKKLGVPSLSEEITRYQQEWKQHLRRMERTRIPKLAFQYAPTGHRGQGRPKHRWKDRDHLR
ncbi:hypothetical protein ANN_14713 [Periplaneta americana]|uniref:Uncharacterized protein n=1 Tax=Periplaneta americana TaxID=6978 RepID=A0ABQ8SX23_PERAM|nr:hypothetical protein ANN_14713 [Periplaneta americana]